MGEDFKFGLGLALELELGLQFELDSGLGYFFMVRQRTNNLCLVIIQQSFKFFQQCPGFVQLQYTSYYEKNFTFCPGKSRKTFQIFSRTYEQNLRTFQDSKKNPGLFQDVATLDQSSEYILLQTSRL